MKGQQQIKIKGQNIPGNFFGFLNGTNFAPIASAMGGPKIKPRASIPTKDNSFSQNTRLWTNNTCTIADDI